MTVQNSNHKKLTAVQTEALHKEVASVFYKKNTFKLRRCFNQTKVILQTDVCSCIFAKGQKLYYIRFITAEGNITMRSIISLQSNITRKANITVAHFLTKCATTDCRIFLYVLSVLFPCVSENHICKTNQNKYSDIKSISLCFGSHYFTVISNCGIISAKEECFVSRT